MDPDAAHHAANAIARSKTRVNALMALRSIRGNAKFHSCRNDAAACANIPAHAILGFHGIGSAGHFPRRTSTAAGLQVNSVPHREQPNGGSRISLNDLSSFEPD